MVPLKMKDYDDVYFFSDDLGRVVNSDRAFGYLDTNGIEVIPPKFHNAADFSEGLASVQFDGKWGFIDKTGSEVIQFIYDDATSFKDGLACVGKKNKFGFIDKTGKEVISLEYESCENFVEGLAAVKKANKWGFINKSGDLIIPNAYDYVSPFIEGMAEVWEGQKKMWINKKNQIVPEPKQETVIFQENDMFGLKDKFGKIILKPKYEEIRDFHDGLASVNNNYRIGAIDEFGNEIIPLKYEENQSFRELYFDNGFSLVVQNEEHEDTMVTKIFYIDKVGKEYRAIDRSYTNLDFLKELQGRYAQNDLKLLQNSKIKERLIKIMGTKDYETMLSFWMSESPIEIINENYFFAKAFLSHNCCDPYFILMADVSSNLLFVAMKNNGINKFYSEKNAEIPYILKQKINDDGNFNN